MRFAIFLIAVSLLASESPSRYTCRADQTVLPDKTSWWHQRVTTDNGKTWKLYSIRPGSETKKALDDCAKWLKEQTKKTK